MRRSTILEHFKDRVPTNVEKARLVRVLVLSYLSEAHKPCDKLLGVAEGLAYLHRQNVVHGNLSGVRR
jgi:hypothetical protein